MCLTLSSQASNDLKNLMPLQYLQDTNCCSLLPPGGAAVELRKMKISGKLQE